jgi:hypothetical protein
MEPVALVHLDVLCRPLIELARSLEAHAAELSRDYLAGMHQAALRKLDEGRACLRLLFLFFCVSLGSFCGGHDATRLFILQPTQHSSLSLCRVVHAVSARSAIPPASLLVVPNFGLCACGADTGCTADGRMLDLVSFDRRTGHCRGAVHMQRAAQRTSCLF